MSSTYVRTEILTFLGSNAPTETFLDMTGLYDELQDWLDANSVSATDPWVGVQFVGSDEVPLTINANGVIGRYRELGSIYIHVVEEASPNVADSILSRAEALRNLLRGKRIGEIIVESVSPTNFDFGAALQFEAGYMSGTFILNYERDFDL